MYYGFSFVFQLKGGKRAQLNVLRATHDGQYRAANLMMINPLQSASSLPALHRALSLQDLRMTLLSSLIYTNQTF